MVGGREAPRFASEHPNKPSRLPLSSRRDGHAADMPNMSEVGQTRRAGSIDGSSAAFVVRLSAEWQTGGLRGVIPVYHRALKRFRRRESPHRDFSFPV